MTLVPPGEVVVTFTAAPFKAPRGLAILGGGAGNQMVAEALRPVETTSPIRDLGKPDVPAMLELVALTEPGPF